MNFVGKDTSMDVALTADKKISREKHMMVLYDPKEKKFTVHMRETKLKHMTRLKLETVS